MKAKISIEYPLSIVGTDVLGGPKKQEINISFWSVIFVLKTYRYSICNRYDIGPSGTPVPTGKMEILISAIDGCSAVTDMTSGG